MVDLGKTKMNLKTGRMGDYLTWGQSTTIIGRRKELSFCIAPRFKVL